MAGKFLGRGAIIDTIKSQERTNAIQRRDNLTMHPVRTTSCGCPDPNCGAWHTIITDRVIPTSAECESIIKSDNKARKSTKNGRKA